MGHDVSDAIFVVTDCFRATVKIAGTIILPVEVPFAFESIVAMERDDELDAITFGIVHDIVQSVKDFIVPGLGSIAF